MLWSLVIVVSVTAILTVIAFFTSRTGNGFSTHGTAAAHGGHGARAGAGRIQGQRAEIHGRHVPLGQHEEARRDRGARHVGSRGIWRPWPAGVRYGAAARGDCEDLLRHRHGHPWRG